MTAKENKDTSNIFSGLDGLLDGSAAKQTKRVSVGLVQLEKAPNPIIFAESPAFLGIPKLYPFQYKILRDFFELLCPFCNDVPRIKLQDDVPIADQVLYEFGVCPQCGFDKYSAPEDLYFYNELVGCGGMRGSKSVLAAIIAHWLTHEALCIDNLQERLGLLGSTLEGAFAAVSAEQAAETVWDHYTNMYKISPWYTNYRNELKKIEKDPTSGYKGGQLLNDGSGKYIYFGDRKLRIKSLHSNSGSLAGKTRLFSIIDELSRFDSGESRTSAQEVYRVMKRSLATVTSAVNRLREKSEYAVPDARMVSISSPLFDQDRTMRLLEEAKSQRRMFAFHAATWEMNPHITREDLADEFERDPLGAQRDYAAQPPGAESPLIDDPRIVDVCIDIDRPSIFKYREKFFELEVQGVLFNYITLEILNIDYRNLYEYVIHCDPGRSKDCFGLAISHMEDDCTILDGILEVRPIPRGNREKLTPRKVYFPDLTNLLLQFNRLFSLRAVTFDRWNSIEQIDRLREAKILAVASNLDRDDHVKFVESIRNRKFKFPKKEHATIDPRVSRNMPVAKAIMELKSLNDDGRHVPDHPIGGSNDLIQCVIGTHKMLTNPGKIISKKTFVDELQRKNAPNMFRRGPGQVVHLKKFV